MQDRLREDPDYLVNLIGKGSQEDLLKMMEESPGPLFATPESMAAYWNLKGLDPGKARTEMPRIILAWLAFLNGDNAGLYELYGKISQTALSSPGEISMYHSLRAFVEGSRDPAKALEYAGMALEQHKKDEISLFHANALLTHGQILAGTDGFRQAAEEFAQSYRLFDRLDLAFPAVVALVNESLNLYRLGEFLQVITMCQDALMKATSFRHGLPEFWQVVNLPMGMCHYELGRFGMAIRDLEKAKRTIDGSGLFHMHGLVELYLFRTRIALGDMEAAEALRDDSIARFGNMHHSQYDRMLNAFRVYTNYTKGYQGIRADVEDLELAYSIREFGAGAITLQTLAFLKARGLSQALNAEDMEKHLEKSRFTGNIPEIHACLVQLTELNCEQGADREALGYLREAIRLSKEYGIISTYYGMTDKAFGILHGLDAKLHQEILGPDAGAEQQQPMQNRLLTAREREIMSLVSTGASNDEIGKTLYIGVGTIKWHINHIFSKLGVKNRVQAVATARSMGEIE